MANTSNIQVTISLSDSSLDEEDLQSEVEKLLPQIREVDGVEDVNLVPVAEAPQGLKALGGFLVGLLMAEVNPANIKALFTFLSERMGGKPIEMSLKAADGRELNIKANSKAEFDYAYEKAQKFLKS